MTGRELITYILENHLENEPVFKDGKFVGFITLDEAAVKLKAGRDTVRAMIALEMVEGVSITKDTILVADRRETFDKHDRP